LDRIILIGLALLVLWYLSDPEPVAVVDRVPAVSVGVNYDPDRGGISVQAVF
jgi:hypothetical protein